MNEIKLKQKIQELLKIQSDKLSPSVCTIRNGELIKLTVENVGWKEIPETLQEFKHLEILCIREKNVNQLPEWLGTLKTLKELFISMKDLGEIPPSLGQLKILTFLEIRDSRIVDVPIEICLLNNLETLSLTNNQLEILPNGIENLKRLMYLDLSYNKIYQLPKSTTDLNNLESLNLSHNKLTELPITLGELTLLNYLDVAHNQLTWLPEIFGDLNLRNFEFENNPWDLYMQNHVLNAPLKFMAEQMRHFAGFLPRIMQKIQTNQPMDYFDRHNPYYGKYAEILTTFCKQHPTNTAQEVLRIIEERDQVKMKSFSILT